MIPALMFEKKGFTMSGLSTGKHRGHASDKYKMYENIENRCRKIYRFRFSVSDLREIFAQAHRNLW